MADDEEDDVTNVEYDNDDDDDDNDKSNKEETNKNKVKTALGDRMQKNGSTEEKTYT
jgi:hypothetical protein